MSVTFSSLPSLLVGLPDTAILARPSDCGEHDLRLLVIVSLCPPRLKDKELLDRRETEEIKEGLEPWFHVPNPSFRFAEPRARLLISSYSQPFISYFATAPKIPQEGIVHTNNCLYSIR